MADVSFRAAGSGDFENNETSADVIPASGSGTFQKHAIQISVELVDETTSQKTLNWELKNITDNQVLTSGSWAYDSDTHHTITKSLEKTTNLIGKTIRMRAWLSNSQTAKLLVVSLHIQTWFT